MPDEMESSGERREDPSDGQSARTHEGMAGSPGLKLRLEERLGLLRDLRVATYPSHGTPDWLRVKGRLLEHTAAAGSGDDDDSMVENALRTLGRLESDEIPGAEITAEYRGARWSTVTDDEGYFSFRIEPRDRLEPGWHRVPLQVCPPFDRDPLEAEAPVLVPDPDAGFAVVSDLDDTVVQTHATDTLAQARMVFTHNATTRPPFRGVGALYRGLRRGGGGEGENPLFYVSLSGWNLYDLFEEFFDVHDLPRGPFFMQELRIVEDPSSHMSHEAPKLERIGILLENYPDLPFVLIGDSGQEDPENYRRIVDRHPGRIRAVYIRDVTPDDRDRSVERIAEEVRAKGVPMLLVKDSLAAAEHAHGLGLITESAVEEVRREIEWEKDDGGGDR